MFETNEVIKQFWEDYYEGKSPRVLFVLGKGFDPRMNNCLKLFAEKGYSKQIECITIDFPSKDPSNTDALYNANQDELNQLFTNNRINNIPITIEPGNDSRSRMSTLYRSLDAIDIEKYSDIIIDVSSLPRVIYFNVVKSMYHKINDIKSQNLFLMVSENVEIDSKISKEYHLEEVNAMAGFKGASERQAIIDQKSILLPLMGEGQVNALTNIFDSEKFSDVCPVLPFPSRDPRRSDNLLLEYRGLLKDRILITSQDITYADERNPFEVYRILSNLIGDYKKTLKPISDHVNFGIALLSSKLQSIGALLVALENSNDVAIYNISTSEYKVDQPDILPELNNKSESFLLWIKGEAYE